MNNSKLHYTLFFWIGILLILVLNLLLWIYVNQVEDKFASNLSNRLTSTNKSMARLIDTEYLELIVPGEINSLEYFAIYEILQDVRKQDSLQSVLLLSTEGEIIVASPEILSLQKEISNKNNKYFEQAKNNLYQTSQLENISKEWFMSSYGPISDLDGRVVAILVIEARATFFNTLNTLRNQLLLFSMINILVIGIIAVFLFRMTDRAFKYQETIKNHEHLVQLGTMGASVAHEIRNPLGIIEGSNDLIKRKYGQSDDEIFNYIPSEVKRLTAIIESFLTFARTPKINNNTFSIERLIARIKIGIQSKKFTIENKTDNDFHVFSDENLLEQALLNIIKNALESGNEDIKVSLHIFNQRNKTYFKIEDSGKGIEKEILDKIYQPFFTTKEKGTGLGLAITKRIIEMLNGQISVQSVIGKGSEFLITLPTNLKKNKINL